MVFTCPCLFLSLFFNLSSTMLKRTSMFLSYVYLSIYSYSYSVCVRERESEQLTGWIRVCFCDTAYLWLYHISICMSLEQCMCVLSVCVSSCDRLWVSFLE